MYDYGYDYTTSYYNDAVASSAGKGFGVFGIVTLAFSIFLLISMWKVYKKAGKKGWASIVPIYNIIVLIEIAELPMWYIALFFVPIANIYAMFKVLIEVAHKFGKSTGFGVGMIFLSPIFLPILAFGSAKYEGNVENNNGSPVPVQEQNTNVNQSVVDNNIQQNVGVMNFNNPGVNNNQLNNNGSSFEPVGNLNNNIMNTANSDNVVENNNVNPVPEVPVTPTSVNPVSINQAPEVPVAPASVNPVNINPVPEVPVAPASVNPTDVNNNLG